MVASLAQEKAPEWGMWGGKVGKVAWGLDSQRPRMPVLAPEPSPCMSSRKHQKFKKCLPHIFRHSPEESEYHEIRGRGENRYFCSLKKNSSCLSIPGGIDKIRGTGFLPLMSAGEI